VTQRRWRAVIVDDEPLARRGVRARLERAGDVDVVAEAGDVASAVECIRQHRPDVAFLDIEMPGATGFRVVGELPEADRPIVVFVTAHDDRALEAFEVQAFDYLLKPIDDAKFARTIDRIRRRLSSGPEAAPARITIRDRGRIVVLDATSIDWLQSDGDYVRLHAGRATYLHHEALASLLGKLPATFVRVHRSAAVNVERIRELEPLTNGDYSLVLTTGARLKVSRTHRAELSRHIGRDL
jgi:two-component system LytT family response regulator